MSNKLRVVRTNQLFLFWKRKADVLTLRILNPPLETPDPLNDTRGASKRMVLTPHDIPTIPRAIYFKSIP